MKKEEITLYCTWCGRKLVYKKDRLRGYARSTGNSLYHIIYACPKRCYLRVWHDMAFFIRGENGTLREVFPSDY